jgi:pilus assembly protein Flp/PilA
MMMNMLKRLVREEEGQDLIEYALLAALLAIASIVVLNSTAGAIGTFFGNVTTALGS